MPAPRPRAAGQAARLTAIPRRSRAHREFSFMRQHSRLARTLASAAAISALAVGLAGCQTAGMRDVTGSLGARAEMRPDADPRSAIDAYGERYRANPKDPDAALRYGQALRGTGQRSQAVAVFEQATIVNPGARRCVAPVNAPKRSRCSSRRP
eukprot:gene8007-10833_t